MWFWELEVLVSCFWGWGLRTIVKVVAEVVLVFGLCPLGDLLVDVAVSVCVSSSVERVVVVSSSRSGGGGRELMKPRRARWHGCLSNLRARSLASRVRGGGTGRGGKSMERLSVALHNNERS